MGIRKLKFIVSAFILSITLLSTVASLPLHAAYPNTTYSSDGFAQNGAESGQIIGQTSDGAFDGDLSIQGGVNAAHGDGQPVELFGSEGIITTITNILLFIVGALSVIMIIFGGLRYVTSGGNPTSVTAAKNTILYAIVGLVVAFLAYAAINFVLGALVSDGAAFTDF